MKTNLWIAVALMSAILAGAASSADARSRNLCATEALAGKWMFATGIGRQMLGEPFPPDEDITAVGTWNVDRYGNLEGVFGISCALKTSSRRAVDSRSTRLAATWRMDSSMGQGIIQRLSDRSGALRLIRFLGPNSPWLLGVRMIRL